MRLRADLTLRKLGDEYLIVDPGQDMIDMSKVFTLNDTAAKLWEYMQDKDFEAEAMVQVLVSHFEVEEEVATQDVLHLLDQLEQHELVYR